MKSSYPLLSRLALSCEPAFTVLWPEQRRCYGQIQYQATRVGFGDGKSRSGVAELRSGVAACAQQRGATTAAQGCAWRRAPRGGTPQSAKMVVMVVVQLHGNGRRGAARVPCGVFGFVFEVSPSPCRPSRTMLPMLRSSMGSATRTTCPSTSMPSSRMTLAMWSRSSSSGRALRVFSVSAGVRVPQAAPGGRGQPVPRPPHGLGHPGLGYFQQIADTDAEKSIGPTTR